MSERAQPNTLWKDSSGGDIPQAGLSTTENVTDDNKVATEQFVLDHAGGGAVDSVNGQTGVVVLDNSDIGLGNVTNDAQLKAADLDTDSLFTANSDSRIPSQKALKTAMDKITENAFANRTYGSALITNGTFTGGTTGWTLGGGAAYGSNNLSVVAGATFAQSVSITAGVTYNITISTALSEVDFSIGSVSGKMICTQNAVASALRGTFIAKETGSYTLTFTATATDTIDSVSMRAVTANPYSQVGGISVGGGHKVTNTVLGYSALANVAIGGANDTAIGYLAQAALTSGVENVAVGAWTQQALTTGSQNTAIGNDAQQSLKTGVQNTAVGCDAQTAVTGSYNTAVGSAAQAELTSGTQNTAIGTDAAISLTTGNNNTAIGWGAGAYETDGNIVYPITTASETVVIGAAAGLSSATQYDGSTAIGYNAKVSASYGFALGHSSAADHDESIALGHSTATSAADQMAIGPRHLELAEVTAPGNGGADSARLYAVDNGSGKTQLVVVFSSGAAQVLATQP